MSRAGIILRVVLGLSLMLNGIGSSLATTTMAAVSLGSATGSDPTAQPEQSGCSDHAAVTHHQPATPWTDPSPEAPAGHSDCCGVDLCGCACAQLSSLAAIELLFEPPDLEHGQLSDAIASSRPSPSMPHLIRPPIA